MQLLRKMEPVAVEQSLGTVLAVDSGEGLTLATAWGRLAARRAASCLLMPELGDRVLAVVGPEGCWVLAVLERASSRAAELRVEGDARLGVSGRLTVTAKEGLELTTPKGMTLLSQTVELHASEGSVLCGRLKLLAGSVDAVLDRLSQKVKSAYRFIDGLEHVRAGTLDYAAKDSVRLHGKNALVTAQELVKMDGEQIHMG